MQMVPSSGHPAVTITGNEARLSGVSVTHTAVCLQQICGSHDTQFAWKNSFLLNVQYMIIIESCSSLQNDALD